MLTPEDGARATFDVHLLGPFTVYRDGRDLHAGSWPRRSRRLLTLLLLAPDRRVLRHDLVHQLWPRLVGTEAGAANVRGAVHELRHHLGDLHPSPVSVQRGWVSLDSSYRWSVDLERFQELVEVQGDDLLLLEEALTLGQTEPLPEDHDKVWAEAVQARVQRLWRAACLRFARASRAQGVPERSIAFLEELWSRDRLDEEAARELAVAYAARGQYGEGLRVYADLATRVREALGTEPSAEFRMVLTELQAGAAAAEADAERCIAAGLPAPFTSFIGRERDLALLTALLGRSSIRMISLVGAPGVGKTRLAIEAARRMVAEFTDGVLFLPLAAVTDDDLVLSTIARALGAGEIAGRSGVDLVAGIVGERKLLIVLDTLEHLVAAAADLETLLARCPRLSLLITSRSLLRIPSEHDFEIAPLDLPEIAPTGPEAVERSAAGALFVERARSNDPTFMLTVDNATAVAGICHKLAGLPLALELAAAQAADLSLPSMLARLEQGLEPVGVNDRAPLHCSRALRVALDRSHEPLDGRERSVFRRLAVFAGGCAPEAAESVCTRGDEAVNVTDAVVTLAEKSLVRIERGPRYLLLDPIQEYAREQLHASGEAGAVEQAHAQYYLELAETAEKELTGPEASEWLARLETEHDNLRATLRWAIEQPGEEVRLRLAGALWRFWAMHGHPVEGRRWIEMILAHPSDQPSVHRARASLGAGNLLWMQGDYESARRYHEECLGLCRRLGNPRGVAAALWALAILARDMGEYDRAIALHEEALALQRETGNRQGEAAALGNLAVVYRDQGLYDRARALQADSLAIRRELGHQQGIAGTLLNIAQLSIDEERWNEALAPLQESLQLFRELGDRSGAAQVSALLGLHALEHGDPGAALTQLQECLTIFKELGDQAQVAAMLAAIGRAVARTGDDGTAVRLHGAAAALRDALHTPEAPPDRARTDEFLAQARVRLGTGMFDTLWDAGLHMPVEKAVAAALSPQPLRQV